MNKKLIMICLTALFALGHEPVIAQDIDLPTAQDIIDDVNAHKDALKDAVKRNSSSSHDYSPPAYGYVNGVACFTAEDKRRLEEEDKQYRTVTTSEGNTFFYKTREGADGARQADREGRIFRGEIYQTRAAADAARENAHWFEGHRYNTIEAAQAAEEAAHHFNGRRYETIAAAREEAARVAVIVQNTRSQVWGYRPAPPTPVLMPMPTRSEQRAKRPQESSGDQFLSDLHKAYERLGGEISDAIYNAKTSMADMADKVKPVVNQLSDKDKIIEAVKENVTGKITGTVKDAASGAAPADIQRAWNVYENVEGLAVNTQARDKADIMRTINAVSNPKTKSISEATKYNAFIQDLNGKEGFDAVNKSLNPNSINEALKNNDFIRKVKGKKDGDAVLNPTK